MSPSVQSRMLRPSLEFIGSPSRLPRAPRGRVAVLDVAFASGEKLDEVTEPFIAALGDRLALWCDHHEHPLGWARHLGDPRFVLLPNRLAHACPELVTPEVANRAGPLDHLVVHGDFDGLLTAVKLLRQGAPPYPEADEDARAVDSPGRGHALSSRGEHLSHAVDEALASFTAGERRDFFQALVEALVEDAFPSELEDRIDLAARASAQAQLDAESTAREAGRGELPGLFVVRLQGRRKGRERKAILRFGEERAVIGVVLESEGLRQWLTAATFDEELDLSEVRELSGGRSDYRYCESQGASLEPVLHRLSKAARSR